jgi:sugar phosphate isomerase/epimerase
MSEEKGHLFGFCHEVLVGANLWNDAVQKIIPAIARQGYSAVEIGMPFVRPLKPPASISGDERRLIRSTARDCGVALYTHWIASMDPQGALFDELGFYPQIAGVPLGRDGTPATARLDVYDDAIQQRTLDFMGQHFDFCGEIGALACTFGSPKARNRPPGYKESEYEKRAMKFWREVGDMLNQFKVTFCLEPLAAFKGDSGETNYATTAGEARCIVDKAGRKAKTGRFRLTLDCKAMASEQTPAPEIIAQSGCYVGHFHLNDPTDGSRRAPGFGSYDFVPGFKALRGIDYRGAVSVEPFGREPSGAEIMRKSYEAVTRAAEEAGFPLLTLG